MLDHKTTAPSRSHGNKEVAVLLGRPQSNEASSAAAMTISDAN